MARTLVQAVVFDAYGTLYDVHSVTALAERLVPGRGAELSLLWRTKQLEYSWLGSLMARDDGAGSSADFAAVTAIALDYALKALAVQLSAPSRTSLLDAYLHLRPFDDAASMLEALASRPRWILSNGSRAMLDPLVQASGLAPHLDGVLSAQAAGVFKPSPRVYQLAVEALQLPAAAIGFVSSNCWDAIGARQFGFSVFWVNRGSLPVDPHGPPPDRIVSTLAEVPGAIEDFAPLGAH